MVCSSFGWIRKLNQGQKIGGDHLPDADRPGSSKRRCSCQPGPTTAPGEEPDHNRANPTSPFGLGLLAREKKIKSIQKQPKIEKP